MKRIAPLMLAFAALAGCAPTRPQMYVPNEAEVKACEAKGGSIQPAYALHEYVCFLSGPTPAAPTPNPSGTPTH